MHLQAYVCKSTTLPLLHLVSEKKLPKHYDSSFYLKHDVVFWTGSSYFSYQKTIDL